MTRRHVIALIACGLATTGCQRRRRGLIETFGTFPSPSGALLLTVARKEESLVEFHVSPSSGGAPLFRSNRIGSDAMRWFLHWESDTSLWAYGSDAGHFARIDFAGTSVPVENPVPVGSTVPRPVWDALSSSAREKYKAGP